MKEVLKKHGAQMNTLSEEIKHATGYRKKDLIRQWRKMKKERETCLRYLQGR